MIDELIKMKKINTVILLLISSLFVISIVAFLLFNSILHNEDSNENSNENDTVIKNVLIAAPVSNMQNILNMNKGQAKYQKNPTSKILRIAHQILVEKYNITVTDDEVREFMNDYYGSMIDDNEFAEMKKKLDAQVAAVAAVVEDGMTPLEAVNTYFKPFGPVEAFMPLVENVDQKKLDEMRRMLPSNREDMFEKSIEGNRGTAEMIKLAPFILTEEQRQGDFQELQGEYKAALFDYAEKNLIGKHPLLMDIKSGQLDIFNTENN
jgi:hypothetical protein